jgi:hypothetical protein
MSKALEAAAIAMCDSWGYCWEGDPEDDQVIAEDSRYPDCRPDKKSFREASQRAVLAYLRALAEEGPSEAMLDAGEEAYGDVYDAEYFADGTTSDNKGLARRAAMKAMLAAHIKELEGE